MKLAKVSKRAVVPHFIVLAACVWVLFVPFYHVHHSSRPSPAHALAAIFSHSDGTSTFINISTNVWKRASSQNEPNRRPRRCFSDAYPLRALTVTFAQLTGRETALRTHLSLPEQDNPIHTLGETRRTAEVLGRAPQHDAWGLCVVQCGARERPSAGDQHAPPTCSCM